MNKHLHLPIAVFIWMCGHIALAVLFVYLLVTRLPSFWFMFWSFSFMHFCWLEIAREYNRTHF